MGFLYDSKQGENGEGRLERAVWLERLSWQRTRNQRTLARLYLNCFRLNYVPSTYVDVLFPVPQNLTLFRSRVVAGVIS